MTVPKTNKTGKMGKAVTMVLKMQITRHIMHNAEWYGM